MENFDAFLQVIGWCGLEYGAVHLRLPKKEEDGFWWKTTKDGRVNKSLGYRFEVRIQDLVPMGREGSQAFQLNWVGMKKLDERTCFSNWAEALRNRETWEEEDSKILWEKVLRGEGKQGKLYGVDTPGMQISIQFYSRLLTIVI